MMGKAVLTKEQAVAIELGLASYGWSKKSILLQNAEGCETEWVKEMEPLRTMDFDLLASAMYEGYEIELTKEELLLESYNHKKKFNYEEGANAMKETLKILEIEIEGINK